MNKLIHKIIYQKIICLPFINPLIRKIVRSSIFYDSWNRWRDKRLYKENNHISKHMIKKLINKNNPVVVEIGASTGSDSIAFLQVFRDNIQLHCIEPSQPAIEKFKERLNQYKKRHTDVNCKLYEIAISNKNKYCELQLLADDPECVMGTLKAFTREGLADLNYLGTAKRLSNKIKVKTMTLDKWAKENRIDTIDFIWADVEGSERELIEGGLETLNKKTRYFYLEVYPNNKTIWKEQIKLKEILDLLPNFEIIEVFSAGGCMDNVLLKNNSL